MSSVKCIILKCRGCSRVFELRACYLFSLLILIIKEVIFSTSDVFSLPSDFFWRFTAFPLKDLTCTATYWIGQTMIILHCHWSATSEAICSFNLTVLTKSHPEFINFPSIDKEYHFLLFQRQVFLLKFSFESTFSYKRGVKI